MTVTGGGPIFTQIADQLTDQIADGLLAEGQRIPSTNELSAFYRVNPATAARALSALVDEGLADKRRGVGMFVTKGARARLVRIRRRQFVDRHVRPMATEAARLGIDREELVTLVHDELTSAITTTTGPVDRNLT